MNARTRTISRHRIHYRVRFVEQLEKKVAHYMRYSGQAVEIFGWTPSGQSIPCLRSHAIGENIGDHAFVDERAMYWDGDTWLPLLWKDFAVWTRADTAPKRRASDVNDLQIELDFPLEAHDEIDLDNLPVGDGELEYELQVRAE